MASSILGAVTGGIGDIKESLHVPFLEESGEEALKTAIPYLARLYRIFAKIFAKVTDSPPSLMNSLHRSGTEPGMRI